MVFAINYYDLSMDYTYLKKRKILVWIMAFIICLEMSKTLNFIWDFEFEKQKLKNVEIFGEYLLFLPILIFWLNCWKMVLQLFRQWMEIDANYR